MYPILIAHRGNTTVSCPEKENSPEYIDNALQQGYDVEIDVWLIDNTLYLGHDKPQYEVKLEYLQNPKLWCHAKNINALILLTKHKETIHSFSHNIDDYILTSKGIIWAYPGRPIDSNIVCVMPERANYSYKDLKNCLGICSDNVEFYRTLFTTKHLDELGTIYDEMTSRHGKVTPKFDNNLLLPEDTRFCLALYHRYDDYILHTPFMELTKSLKACNLTVYTPDILNNNTLDGTLHFTLLQLLGFDFFTEYVDTMSIAKITELISDEIKSYLPIQIEYRKLIIVPAGVIMLGYPDKDINCLRDCIRNKLALNGIIIREPYLNNIVHSTVARFSEDPKDVLDAVYDAVNKHNNKSLCSIIVNDFTLGYGTWRLNKCETLDKTVISLGAV